MKAPGVEGTCDAAGTAVLAALTQAGPAAATRAAALPS